MTAPTLVVPLIRRLSMGCGEPLQGFPRRAPASARPAGPTPAPVRHGLPQPRACRHG
ncbi:hypothetical protein [uncultured Thiodictyon sp.]|uniref:hypothetical protein n=1 Tax=uncultured Thiodictyon sp. TaxID=1846217 RepID=UPI0025FE3819|nr:hypothetical protein [uncultured Thiodictyon sp.]